MRASLHKHNVMHVRKNSPKFTCKTNLGHRSLLEPLCAHPGMGQGHRGMGPIRSWMQPHRAGTWGVHSQTGMQSSLLPGNPKTGGWGSARGSRGTPVRYRAESPATRVAAPRCPGTARQPAGSKPAGNGEPVTQRGPCSALAPCLQGAYRLRWAQEVPGADRGLGKLQGGQCRGAAGFCSPAADGRTQEQH